jgi:HEAT repeat protein
MTSCCSIVTTGLLAIGLTLAATNLRAEIQPDYMMMSDPAFTFPISGTRFDERLPALWARALERPDSHMIRLAADAIIAAYRDGFTKVDATRPALLKALAMTETQHASRWGVARALIVLESKDAAEALFQAAEKDPRLRDVVEPALAEWDYQGVRGSWRKRIQDPASSRRDLLLAIRCLGRVRDSEGLESLLGIIRDRDRPADVRLASARAAGETADSGLEGLAGELSPSPAATLIDRLCAISLLARHQSDDARGKLAAYARDPEPVIAAQALRRLHAIDPALVLPLAEDAMLNRDGDVRFEGIRCYVVLPTPQRIAIVGRQLNDPHPRNRYFLREEFFRLTQQPELDGPVREAITTVLAGEDWRGQEQASLLIAALDHKPAAPRLIELLESARPEVMASTAWALRKLALPDTLPAIFDKASRQKQKPSTGFRAVDPQLAHLFEAMASMDYQPAVPLLRQYVPKDPGRDVARGAAIWSLGHLLKSTPDEELGNQLLTRYLDTAGMPPEDALVRQMCAITIGRMKTKGQVAVLRKTMGPETFHSPVDYAVRWAVERITGEIVPFIKVPEVMRTGWFLEPAPDEVPETQPNGP